MKDIGAFTAPAQTNSRAGDNDTSQVEGGADEEHVDPSHNGSVCCSDVCE